MQSLTQDKNGDRKEISGENDHGKLFTYQEAGSLLGICATTLRRWAGQGKLRVAKFNSRVIRVPASELTRLKQAAGA